MYLLELTVTVGTMLKKETFIVVGGLTYDPDGGDSSTYSSSILSNTHVRAVVTFHRFVDY